MECIEVRAVQWPEIWKFIRVSYIIALSDLEAANDTQNDSVDTARGKIMTSRIYQNDNVISQRATYITKSLQMPEDTIILFISS